MFKRLLSISFILLFIATISLPSIVLLIDDSIDITLLLDISEEEEENEKNKELEIFQVNIEKSKIFHQNKKLKNKTNYVFKTYPTPYLNLIFPPPELV
ncbi:hypothetical protein [Aurantibacter sp.]|uniref:hypothetical protein n=1 Tax=Aurantibacter sp. TaxID=2807103 RepID=UPI0035C84CEE